MCGIVGVVRRRSTRPSPDLRALVKTLEAVAGRAQSWAGDAEVLVDIATAIVDLDAQLRGIPGIRSLIGDDQSRAELSHTAQKLSSDLDGIERSLDAGTIVVASSDLEVVNSALVQAKDGAWAIHADRVRTAEAVAGLARGAGKNEIGEAALEAYASIQIALAGIDRLEVRGRDSAGLHVLIRNSGLSDKDRVDIEKSDRSDIRFGNRTIRFSGDAVGFVYKFAAEIGDLGDNTCRLRHDIENDAILRQALSSDSAEAIILGHTRWASVGIISEFNTHPLDSLEITQPSKKEKPAPCVVAALNGDVDNFVELSSEKNFAFSPEITTDAKAIPVLVARNEIKGDNPQESFRAAVNTLEGSVAIGAALATAPEQLFLALRGSGQALYVGLAEDAFIIASEPYGIVEETSDYLRLDGESVSDSSRANATRGQIVVLDADQAGEISGINRYSYDGSELLLEPQEIERAEITTRDINRGAAPHFLLKEITESPASLRKTLRGRIVENAGLLEVALGDDAMPEKVRKRLASGSIRKVVVIGQGTAAVAGRAVAATLLDANTELVVSSTLATELSGFSVRDDMSDTLVVAISQSGTTTDTNRTVDVVRDRGAAVISIVNRRKSDLVEKSDGVLYTSDGRDVEMSVASTKAFYAQVAAGVLLALAIADSAGRLDPTRVNQWLTGLRALPLAMEKVLESRAAIAAVAQRHAPRLRYWAVVGNGVNKTAANEIRIKLSELCYKAIAVDVTEDKKHIDLSSEPLIVVCAAGLGGSIADDVSKEVAIYRAHRAAPIVITDTPERYSAALETLVVPSVMPELDFVLAAVAGHLFSYEAALAIDHSAFPLRQIRSVIEAATAFAPESLLERVMAEIDVPATQFLDGLRAGNYDGTLTASSATLIASLLRYAMGSASLDDYELEHGALGVPSAVVVDLTAALTTAIEELTRPVDAIKHQAKTVTVGISRSDETLLRAEIVRQVIAAGTPRDSLTYRSLRTLVDLDPAVVSVVGYTRYRVEGDAATDNAKIFVVDKGGVAADLVSRAESDSRLRGTKHRVAEQREVTVVQGRTDGRTLIVIPEVKHGQCVGLTLLHVEFAPSLSSESMRAVLQGYQGRYGALRDAVTETEDSFDDTLLSQVAPIELLTDPVLMLADRWRA